MKRHKTKVELRQERIARQIQEVLKYTHRDYYSIASELTPLVDRMIMAAYRRGFNKGEDEGARNPYC